MKKFSLKSAACCVALLSASAMLPISAHAMDDMKSDGTMMSNDGTMMMSDDGMMMQNGMMMPGALAPSMQMSGSVLRRYTDLQGNVSAIDLLTADGVRQVRFAPAMPASEMMNYRIGTMVSPTGMSSMGVLRFDPDASMTVASGKMMMKGNTTGGKSVEAENGTLPMTGNMPMMSDKPMMNGKMMKGMYKGARLMMVGADGQMMPVMMKGGNAMVKTPTGMLTLMKDANGAYVVPDSMTGARMMLVTKDGQQLPIDTVDGKLMVTMNDGTMRPINAKGQVMMK